MNWSVPGWGNGCPRPSRLVAKPCVRSSPNAHVNKLGCSIYPWLRSLSARSSSVDEKEVTQTQRGFTQQLRQLDVQAQQHVNGAALAQGIEGVCQRIQPTLDTLTFAQHRHLVEWLIDRVIVNDAQVEIRYVVPTSPKGETTPFCHLRLDYLDLKT